MKCKLLTSFLFAVAVMALGSTAVATTQYVNGVSGSNNNNCLSPTTACKTIGYAISLAASGDSVMVAAATYTENLTIGVSLKVIGSGANTTIIDGGAVNTVVTIPNSSANVILSKMTIRNGYTKSHTGGGIDNTGKLIVNNSTITRNSTCFGGGISNSGTLTINNSTISGNSIHQLGLCRGFGAGVANGGTLTINNSTVAGNAGQDPNYGTVGGGIYNTGTLGVNNSTISGNTVSGGANGFTSEGGGIANSGTLKINNSTLSANGANFGGGIYNGNTTTLQNSIVANNSSGGNCSGIVISHGYNLSSDNTCNFTGTGDLNNTNPLLGPLQNNGGPTQTMALASGSPAIEAGNPNGCTDSGGHLLTTDQRGQPRPDKEDSVGCDMGAYESQNVASGPVLTGYCVTWGGYPPGCHQAVDLTHCPPGRPAAGVSNSCGKYSVWSICQVPGFEGGKCLVQ